MEPVINYAAVLAGAVAAFVIGMVWYSPMLFGNTWMKLAGMDPKRMKGKDVKGKMMLSMAGGFVTAFVTSMVTAHIVDYAGAVDLMGGVTAGFWIWLGFYATTQAGVVLWEGKPVKLYLLNTAYSLVSITVIAVINAVMV